MQRRWTYRWIMAILATLSVTPRPQAAVMPLPEIRTHPTPQAVLDEHLDALNKCDWNRLVAQYPEDAQIHLLYGTIITGRKAFGELFAGFCKDPRDGGLNGINFKVVQSTLIGTFATHWVATAPFLTEPYKGSDAYITKDGLMQATVTTFDGRLEDEEMIYSELPHQLRVSAGITLQPGDIIATRTPAGVEIDLEPPKYLLPGEVARVASGGICVRENRFIEARS